MVTILLPSSGAPQPAPTYSMVGTPPMGGAAAAAANPGGAGGSVIMIYGLTHSRIGCDQLFNLLCSYGNVLKVSGDLLSS